MYLHKLKRKIIKKGKFIRHLLRIYFNTYLNSYARKQIKNTKNIPIIIISFNQLFYLKQLIDFLKKCNYTNIVIIDNNSTYKPLLNYFETIDSSVTIHRLNENYGHRVFWERKEMFDKYSKGYYAITDADIVPNKDCPDDFILHFKRILDRNNTITKVGFSLKIDDLPEGYPNKQKVINWEKKFWNQINEYGDYLADIDTTFALYRPGSFDIEMFFKGIRTKKPYEAMHGGWYLDKNNLTDEQKYYFKTANSSSSWKFDANGKLITKMY